MLYSDRNSGMVKLIIQENVSSIGIKQDNQGKIQVSKNFMYIILGLLFLGICVRDRH